MHVTFLVAVTDSIYSEARLMTPRMLTSIPHWCQTDHVKHRVSSIAWSGMLVAQGRSVGIDDKLRYIPPKIFQHPLFASDLSMQNALLYTMHSGFFGSQAPGTTEGKLLQCQAICFPCSLALNDRCLYTAPSLRSASTVGSSLLTRPAGVDAVALHTSLL